MPATYTAPVAQAAATTITDVRIEASAEAPVVTLYVAQTDTNGNLIPSPPIRMTPLAFFTALSGASGTWKQRIYSVALAQLGQTATVT